ncbi:MAG: hypothetical protein ACPGQR_00095 [Marinirhabdus sp.]
MGEKTKKIEKLNELQKLMPRLLEEHNSNQKLMKAALSNPILALEEIGFTLSEEVKKEIEERARFNSKQQKKRKEITEKVYGIAGKKIDLSSKASVTKGLGSVLKNKTIQVGKKNIAASTIIKAAGTKLGPRLFQNKEKKDPLSAYKSAHKIVPLLLAYRKIEASSPQLASKKTFGALLKGKETKTGIQISNVRFRLQDRSERKTPK